MGEVLNGPGPHELTVSVVGTAPIDRIEFRTGGGVAQAVSVEGKREATASWTWTPAGDAPYAFVRVVQEDGHRAWSSPFFVSR